MSFRKVLSFDLITVHAKARRPLLMNKHTHRNKREDPTAKSSEGFLFSCTIIRVVTLLSMTRYNLTKS